jgi:hypothetical protein
VAEGIRGLPAFVEMLYSASQIQIIPRAEDFNMNKRFFLPAGLLVLFALGLNFQSASAHEGITVGDYEIVYGWVNEPPTAGQLNGVEISVNDTSSGEEQPAGEQVVQSLVVELTYGGETRTLTLDPVFDTPGSFAATVIPSIPGLYSLKFSGTLGDASVDTEVELEEVQPADAVQFPQGASTEPVQQNVAVGTADWVIWLSLLLGILGVALGAMALRKTS